MKSHGFRDTGTFYRRAAQSGRFAPDTLAKLVKCLDSNANVAAPIRPRGAGSSNTDCNQSSSGCVIDMMKFNRIVNIDTYNHTVTAQAGVRLGSLIAALAEQGLELVGNFDETERTLGGAVAAPCFGAGIGSGASYLSASVQSMKVVTPTGKPLVISSTQTHLLGAFRLSYGMLGVIFEATLKVRPITTFTASHRGMDIDTFAKVADRVASGDVGMKFYLLPYRNHVYLDLRHYESGTANSHNTPWKIKDWGESTVLPQVFKSLGKVVPIPSLRYQLIDSITAATHGLVNTRLVRSGNNVASGGRHRRRKPRNHLVSTWCFPASDFSLVAQAYARFCREQFARTAYRCDLPAVGHRLARDASALLSPSFDESLIALQTVSTVQRGWDDFVMELADFAENWGGMPLFNQTLSARPEYVTRAYADRLPFFKKLRSQLDPDNRMLNPFLARSFK